MDRSQAASHASPNPHQNHLLDALPKNDYERVASHLELIPIKKHNKRDLIWGLACECVAAAWCWPNSRLGGCIAGLRVNRARQAALDEFLKNMRLRVHENAKALGHPKDRAVTWR
jgi:hypothetical protein